MKIHFHLTALSNVFHVINAISNWDPHCRPNIQAWYRAVFGLTTSEEALLSGYAQVRQECIRSGKSESLIPAAFLLNQDINQAYESLSLSLSEADLFRVRTCFDYFHENASLLYQRCLPDLQVRMSELEAFKAEAGLEHMLNEMIHFFYAPAHLPDVNIFLLLNTCSGCTGGYAPVDQPGYIAVEPRYLGKTHSDYLSSDFLIAAHEVSHLIFSANPVLKMRIEEELVKVGLATEMAMYVEEALIVSQFPGGYLAVKHGLASEPKLLKWINEALPSQQDEPNLYIYTLQNKVGAAIYPLAMEYIKQSKAITEGDFLAFTVSKLRDVLNH